MESVYTQTFPITDLHVDCFRRLRPAVLLYLIQEVSATHAARLGTGWEALAGKNLFWAIIRHQVEISRMPLAGETITLETWPMPTTRTAYPRATAAYDEKGNLLFRSHALWAFMDLKNRSMVLPGKSGVEVPGILRGDELSAPTSIAPKAFENLCSHQVGYTLLDRNGHMNNTRYMEWVDDLLPAEFHREHVLRSLRICYLSEAREGQQVDLHWEKSEENILSVEARTGADSAHRVFAVNARYAELP